jgi:hypothetical protein
MKVSNNFIIQEFIPPELYDDLIKKYGENNDYLINGFYKFMSKDIVDVAQKIRDFLGKPMIINDWHTGGKFNYRGFRPYDYFTNGIPTIKYSQHQMGRAIDFHTYDLTAQEIRDLIIPMYKDLGFSAIEEVVNWIHVDCRHRKNGDLLRFNP